jgi:hypothetical protein
LFLKKIPYLPFICQMLGSRPNRNAEIALLGKSGKSCISKRTAADGRPEQLQFAIAPKEHILEQG